MKEIHDLKEWFGALDKLFQLPEFEAFLWGIALVVVGIAATKWKSARKGEGR